MVEHVTQCNAAFLHQSITTDLKKNNLHLEVDDIPFVTYHTVSKQIAVHKDIHSNYIFIS